MSAVLFFNTARKKFCEQGRTSVMWDEDENTFEYNLDGKRLKFDKIGKKQLKLVRQRRKSLFMPVIEEVADRKGASVRIGRIAKQNEQSYLLRRQSIRFS